MLAYLHGTVIAANEKSLTVELNGIGFEVFVTPTLALATKTGTTIELHTHLNVREDALELFGFLSAAERDFFRQLLTISGVGPRSALGVLAVASVDDVRQAVISGDPSLLMTVSGIGRKTAERIVVELKEKLARETTDRQSGLTAGDGTILDALINLGYTAQEAREALRAVPSSVTEIDDRLKAALRSLGKK